MANDWYAEGLRFECRRCGRCCRGPGGYVWLSPEETAAIADALGMTLSAFGKRYLRNTLSGPALVDSASGDCPLLGDDGRCRVYGARPRQCRTWPWWKQNLRARADWDDEAKRCPGMNRGRLWSAEEIAARLRADEGSPEEFV